MFESYQPNRKTINGAATYTHHAAEVLEHELRAMFGRRANEIVDTMGAHPI